jgi:hypothetical protein
VPGPPPTFLRDVRDVFSHDPAIVWTAPAVRWRLQIAGIAVSYTQIRNALSYLYERKELKKVGFGKYRWAGNDPGGSGPDHARGEGPDVRPSG